MRYGISSCKSSEKDLAMMRKQIVDWQLNEDAGALNETSIQFQTWLGVTYDDVIYSQGGTGYINTGSTGPSLGLVYTEGGANQNIIQVSAGGCITRINLNPSITLNQNTSFVHTQTVPSIVWDITHGLNMMPNVRTEDSSGNDIEGVIENVNVDRVKIYFTQAISGKAYLS